jgi:hypothetical protein
VLRFAGVILARAGSNKQTGNRRSVPHDVLQRSIGQRGKLISGGPRPTMMSTVSSPLTQAVRLLVATGPDQCHPINADAFRATASRLAALTGCHRPGKGW